MKRDKHKLQQDFERRFAGRFGNKIVSKKTPAGEYENPDVWAMYCGFVGGIDSVKIKVPATSVRWRDANTAKMEDILNAEIEMRNKFIDACREAGVEPSFGSDIED